MTRSAATPVVLLTDGEQRASLALARSLGRAGYTVFVTSISGTSLAGTSRFAKREFAAPDPLTAPDSFSGRIAELAGELGAALVIPVSEAALLALLASSRINHRLIPFPDLEKVRAICNKAGVLEVARELGIAVPRQQTVASTEEANRIDASSLSYPLVIKPARSVAEQAEGRIKVGVSHAADPDQFRHEINKLAPAAFPVLLQQRIVGPGIGVFLLLWDGEVLAQFSHRRLREKPPAGGVSVYRESIAPDPGLIARSRALLERFQWQGIAMIEYKVDAATNTPNLMEINGRFWGSLQLAIDSGVDFPRLLAEAAAGRAPAPVLSYRIGVRSRWWWGDVDHLIARMKGTRASLGLPPGAPGRLRTLASFLKLWQPGDRNETLRWSDPYPFLRESIQWLKRK